jgi:hypothetical protein
MAADPRIPAIGARGAGRDASDFFSLCCCHGPSGTPTPAGERRPDSLSTTRGSSDSSKRRGGGAEPPLGALLRTAGGAVSAGTGHPRSARLLTARTMRLRLLQPGPQVASATDRALRATAVRQERARAGAGRPARQPPAQTGRDGGEGPPETPAGPPPQQPRAPPLTPPPPPRIRRTVAGPEGWVSRQGPATQSGDSSAPRALPRGATPPSHAGHSTRVPALEPPHASPRTGQAFAPEPPAHASGPSETDRRAAS